METFQCIGSIFGHNNRLVILLIPCGCLTNHTLCDHVQATGVVVPRVVAIKANYV